MDGLRYIQHADPRQGGLFPVRYKYDFRLVVFDGAARSPAYFYNEKVMAGLGAGLAETVDAWYRADEWAQQWLTLSRCVIALERIKQHELAAEVLAKFFEAGQHGRSAPHPGIEFVVPQRQPAGGQAVEHAGGIVFGALMGLDFWVGALIVVLVQMVGDDTTSRPQEPPTPACSPGCW